MATIDRPDTARRRASRLLRVLAAYSGLVWAYVALIAVFARSTLSEPLWQGFPHLRRDTAGALCFALSAASYFAAKIADPGS